MSALHFLNQWRCIMPPWSKSCTEGRGGLISPYLLNTTKLTEGRCHSSWLWKQSRTSYPVMLCVQYDDFFSTLLLPVLLQHVLLSYCNMPLHSVMSHPTLLVSLHFTSCLSSPLTLSFHTVALTAAFYHRKNTRGPLNNESSHRALSPLHHTRLYGL